MILSEKNINYMRFIRDVEYEYYGKNIMKSGREFILGPPDRISNGIYYLCVAHGAYVEFKVGEDVIMVTKKQTITETEEI